MGMERQIVHILQKLWSKKPKLIYFEIDLRQQV